MFNLNQHLLKIITAFFLIIALYGCGSNSDKLKPLTNGATVLAFGDSLTAGNGVESSSSYPAVLSELSGLNVINAGVSGEVSSNGLNRLPELLDTKQPELLILIEGGNDVLQNLSMAELKSNLASMIEAAKSRDIPVVLIGVPEKSLFSNSATLYPELAKEYDLVFNDSLIADLQRSPSMKSDLVHFNQEGYREMAESIYQLLKDNGAIN